MTWIFAVAAAAAMGAAGYWIGRHHQEDQAVYPPIAGDPGRAGEEDRGSAG